MDEVGDIVVRISNEDFTDVTLAIGGQIYNLYKWRRLVAKFATNSSGATW